MRPSPHPKGQEDLTYTTSCVYALGMNLSILESCGNGLLLSNPTSLLWCTACGLDLRGLTRRNRIFIVIGASSLARLYVLMGSTPLPRALSPAREITAISNRTTHDSLTAVYGSVRGHAGLLLHALACMLALALTAARPRGPSSRSWRARQRPLGLRASWTQ